MAETIRRQGALQGRCRHPVKPGLLGPVEILL